ncbi:MAG: TrkH family potassium uptake protein [Longimicrobiales bacterium]|nr:TrkH family potassium uptake protein [Longimicrobiales bacterium]
MQILRVANVVGLLLVFVGLSMLFPVAVALLHADGDAAALLLSALITASAGFATYRLTRFDGELTLREGYGIVTFGWIAIAVFGALPYLLTGSIPGVIPAVFESMSGFTTTGATVLGDIEALPHGVLFWRAFTQWLGGMGIIVLAIAILPFLGIGGMQLFRAEVPGPTPERLRPRVTQTAKLLWVVYFALTAVQAGLYAAGGMGWFDAWAHAFTTLSTGGFSPRNASLAAFSDPWTQWVTILFMYLAGINFALHFRAVTGRFDYIRDIEWRFFTLLVVAGAGTVAAVNVLSGPVVAIEPVIRGAFFQVTSIATTTGFVSENYALWVPAAQVVLFTLFFIGGMAGSTAGGMKTIRVLLLLKQTGMELRKHLHPRAVMLARVGRQVVREDVLANVIGFVILYLLITMAGIALLAFLGLDLMTAIGASLATVGNIGPGWGAVGPADTFGWLSDPALALLTFMMMVGRLEIYTVLLLFMPGTWRRATQPRAPSHPLAGDPRHQA